MAGTESDVQQSTLSVSEISGITNECHTATVGVKSLTEVNEKLGLRYGPKGSSPKILAKGMFADIDKFMVSGETDWGKETMAETGLPGTKVNVDGTIIYIHGISHSFGTEIDKKWGKEELDDFLREWVKKMMIDRGQSVVLESGMKAAYQMNYGNSVDEGSVVEGLFRGKEDWGKLFEALNEALAYSVGSAMMTLIRRGSKNAGITGFLRKLIDGRSSMTNLIELRKSFFRLSQPFYTLLSEAIAPSNAAERSIVLYRRGLATSEGDDVIHFLCGLEHEPHLVALAKSEGMENRGMMIFTKDRLTITKQKLLEYMAVH